MLDFDISIPALQTKFYQYHASFKDFDNIDEQRLEELQEIYKNEFSLIDGKGGLENYINMLTILCNNPKYKKYTFDERLFFLIRATDPKLVAFTNLIKSDILPKQKCLTDIEQEEYDKKRKVQVNAYQKSVRDEIGFYDDRLVGYEAKYFKKFHSNNLLDNIKKDYSETLLSMILIIRNLDGISKERLAELELIADKWLENHTEGDIRLTSAFNIVYQKETLGISNVKEQLILFILINDRNLNALKIYEEESKTKKLEKRCQEELGFYSFNLIQLEQIYHDTFYPNQIISDFTITKK